MTDKALANALRTMLSCRNNEAVLALVTGLRSVYESAFTACVDMHRRLSLVANRCAEHAIPTVPNNGTGHGPPLQLKPEDAP
jgi:hypothetical protein